MAEAVTAAEVTEEATGAAGTKPRRISPLGRRRGQDPTIRDRHSSNIRHCGALAADRPARHLLGMYVVTEADAAAIREAYETGGEFSAAVELRRRFPGIIDNATAREQARRIAAWTPLPPRPARRRKGKVDE
jgi:hypothetical protein